VANTATFLFEATCERDKNIKKKHKIFMWKFCTGLPVCFQLQEGFAIYRPDQVALPLNPAKG